MAWYWYVLIIVVAIFFLSVYLSKGSRERRENSRKYFLEDISTWQVGDELIMIFDQYMAKARENGMKKPKLIKWDKDDLMIDVGDGFTHLIKHHAVKTNHTDYWRMQHTSMDKFMTSIDKFTEYKPKKKDSKGNEVEVDSEMDIKMKGGEIWINDKPLTGMPQIYLSIYQGIALKEENFKLLAKINEELKKHR